MLRRLKFCMAALLTPLSSKWMFPESVSYPLFVCPPLLWRMTCIELVTCSLRWLYIMQVHLARCKPLNTLVAVKLVDLEELSSSLELLIKEAHTMKGLRHPNVLPLHCSFVADSALWLVMPYIGGGNVSQLLRSQYPKGMEEDMILTIAKDILHGLQYLHSHDLAHRDLKVCSQQYSPILF